MCVVFGVSWTSSSDPTARSPRLARTMPSDAAKRRKEERAAKRAAKGSTGLSGKSGGACSCCARGTSCCGGGGSGERDAPTPTDAKTEAASAVTLRFPPSLSSRQRAALHAVAEMHGVAHRSDEEGDARRIALGSGAREIGAVGTVATDPSAPLEDEALCALITEHFRILPAAAKRAFDAPAPTTAARRSPPGTLPALPRARRHYGGHLARRLRGQDPPPLGAGARRRDGAVRVHPPRHAPRDGAASRPRPPGPEVRGPPRRSPWEDGAHPRTLQTTGGRRAAAPAA